MNRTKFKISILALALVFVMSMATFFGINFGNFKSANAAGTVTVNGSSTFSATGANVWVYKQASEDETGYTMFSFGDDDDNVAYKKNLAYNWYETGTIESEPEEGSDPIVTKSVEHGHFNMEIGFLNTSFKKFIITFESQQYEKTEEGKSVNYIIFFSTDDGKVKVVVTDDKDVDAPDDSIALDIDRIYIRFGDKVGGEYPVYINNGDHNYVTNCAMKNVGGNYAKYSSSSTTPVFPLIFSAEFKKDEDGEEKNEEDNKTAQMVLYCLNNQRFVVKNSRSEDDHYVGGTVEDNTPAVLCLNKEISNLNIGGSISFDYQLIDVLRSSPSATLYYYVLKYDDTKEEIDFNYIDEDTRKNPKSDDDDKAKDPDDLYKQVESDFQLDSDRGDYLPVLGKDGGDAYGKDFKVDMAVKVFAEIRDVSSSAEYSYVFLDWYIAPELKLTINGYDFIAVGDNVNGAHYSYDNEDGSGWSDDENGVLAQYQKKVDEAAKNLYAGSSSYFYVPSAESLFTDDATAYTDLKISIYYYSSTQSSNTSLAYNNLSINVTNPGSYTFTLYATDADGNSMYYLEKDDEGNWKPVEFSTGDIWSIYSDEERHDYLPWFTFRVDYKGAQFKEVPGKQSTAYVGVNYVGASFEINGIAGKYEVNYRLFLFDRAGFYRDFGETFSYEEFIDVMDALYGDEYFDNDITRIYFKEIKAVNESDEDYEEFKDYMWTGTGTSFTPLDGNAYYYMRAEVTDTEYNTNPITCSLAVVASIETKTLKGDSEWLQNNIASVILLSIAGVSLIAIILLLVIKPKNKEDIDVQYEKMNEKKGNKKANK